MNVESAGCLIESWTNHRIFAAHPIVFLSSQSEVLNRFWTRFSFVSCHCWLLSFVRVCTFVCLAHFIKFKLKWNFIPITVVALFLLSHYYHIESFRPILFTSRLSLKERVDISARIRTFGRPPFFLVLWKTHLSLSISIGAVNDSTSLFDFQPNSSDVKSECSIWRTTEWSYNKKMDTTFIRANDKKTAA